MINEDPIAFREDMTAIYDNTPTVVVLALTKGSRILAIKRNSDPGKGLWALPGGYHMRGETWQEAGIRELKEETGINITIDPRLIKLHRVYTDHYNNNVIFGHYIVDWTHEVKLEPNENEVEQVMFVDSEWIKANLGFWAFPTHAVTALDVLDDI